jgi:DNA replication protein DnaC
MLVYRRIEAHYTTLLTDQECIDPLRLIMLGTAGTGKSYLIKMIQDRLCEIARDHDAVVSPDMLLVLTGVAAFNIYGSTIHSSFSRWCILFRY